MNYSRIWAPVETKINNYITRTQYPIGDQGLLAHSDVVPLHHMTGHLHPSKGSYESSISIFFSCFKVLGLPQCALKVLAGSSTYFHS